MTTSFEKSYQTATSGYTVKVKKLSGPKKLAKVELFSSWSSAPLWSTLEPLANLESLADAMFRNYCRHIENEIAIEKSNIS